jgi:CCR4-NOT transcription complex subunit 4
LRQFQAAGSSQHQIGTHGRQPSRFSFNETGGIKAGAGLQQPKNLGGFSAAGQQVPFYSGVQGPPPGLKTTGTPPVNGSGMFGQGHGFTSSYAATQNADRAGWDSRTQQRGAQDAGKREFMFPFSHNSSAASTPAPGMGGPAGFSYGGPQDITSGQQKQKKKGKKHRHANTSSSGGDAVGDPSILQARPYQNGAPGLNGGLGQYGAGGPGGQGLYSAYGRNW